MLFIYLDLLLTLKDFLSDMLGKLINRILCFCKLFLKLSYWSCLTGFLLSAWQDLHSFFAPLSSFRQLQLLERCLLISNILFHLLVQAGQLFSFYKSDILFALSFLVVSLVVSLPAGDRHFTLSAAQFLFSKFLNLAVFPFL